MLVALQKREIDVALVRHYSHWIPWLGGETECLGFGYGILILSLAMHMDAMTEHETCILQMLVVVQLHD